MAQKEDDDKPLWDGEEYAQLRHKETPRLDRRAASFRLAGG